jgi:hypothetical protein
MKLKLCLLSVTILAMVLLVSCKVQTFTKTRDATKEIHSLDRPNCIRIVSYSLTYNPRSNGFILIELETGALYEAKSVDGGSFSSINSLLTEPGALFDTTRKEVVIIKSNEN